MEVTQQERDLVAGSLRADLARSTLTQAQFAELLGTSASRMSAYLSGRTMPSAAMYLRAQRTADSIERAQTHRLLTPDSAARAIDRQLAAGDEDLALRLVLQSRDDLRTSLTAWPSTGGLAWRARSTRIGDERFDVLYRAVIGHEFGDDAPAWTRDARLGTAWVLPDPFRSRAAIRQQTPSWLRAANVFISERGLATA